MITPADTTEPDWPELPRSRRAIVVVDVVESVRLMQAHEADVINRWRRVVNEVRHKLLPAQGGRLVKSLGDGLLLEFESVNAAVSTAMALNACVMPFNLAYAPQAWLRLRVGVHVGVVVSDGLDIYGQDVNIAQRLMTLAQPDEIVVSADVADQLVQGVDAEVHDLGLCHVKHLNQPLHAFRLHRSAATGSALVATTGLDDALLPRVAVVPFAGHAETGHEEAIGDSIADSVIARLSASGRMRVISRLSTTVMRARAKRVSEIGQLLKVAYVLGGTFRVAGPRLVLHAELSDARSEEVVWSDVFTCTLAELFQPDCPVADSLALRVADAMAAGELRRVRTLPVPTLEGFSLMLGATMLMHRTSPRDFERAGELLEHLIDRYPRAPEPRAWMAKWYVLRVSRGAVQDMEAEGARALDHTQRALDASPDCSMALAAEGFVHCHMRRNLDLADDRLERALEINPNDSLAWIFRCAVQSFRGAGEQAIAAGERAIGLSPLDPLRHYYEGLASTAALSAGQLARAVELATRSLERNRNHLPTLRTLAIAQVESGSVAAARSTVTRILEIERDFTIERYLERTPRGGEAPRQRYARALREAGVPAN